MKGMLNERIRDLRIRRGINQVQLAKLMNVSKQCVSNWENDNVLPSVEMLQRLADFFGTTTDYLLGRSREDSIDTRGLTEIQIAHITALAEDLRLANSN